MRKIAIALKSEDLRAAIEVSNTFMYIFEGFVYQFVGFNFYKRSEKEFILKPVFFNMDRGFRDDIENQSVLFVNYFSQLNSETYEINKDNGFSEQSITLQDGDTIEFWNNNNKPEFVFFEQGQLEILINLNYAEKVYFSGGHFNYGETMTDSFYPTLIARVNPNFAIDQPSDPDTFINQIVEGAPCPPIWEEGPGMLIYLNLLRRREIDPNDFIKDLIRIRKHWVDFASQKMPKRKNQKRQ